MVSPKSSTTPKAARDTLAKKAEHIAAQRHNDKDDINTGSGQRSDDVKNDARAAYQSPGQKPPRQKG